MRGRARTDANQPKISEAQLQKFGTDLLELDGWRSLRTDPVRNREWGKGFGEKGMPDYLYIRYHNDDRAWRDSPDRHPSTPIFVRSRTQTLWVEWKSKTGTTAQHQKQWHAAERARGGLVVVAKQDFECTPEAFKAWYMASGLNRSIL